MKLSDKLKKRLVELGFMEDSDQIQHVNRGHWGMSAGQWSWLIVDKNGTERCMGSCSTMKECVQANKLILGDGSHWGDVEIYASDVPEVKG